MGSTRWTALASTLLTLLTPGIAGAAVANSLILNEANTVSGGKFLEDAIHTDSVLGRLEGNGQNWMEFAVVQGDDLGGGSYADTLDMRGWTLEWEYNKDGLELEFGSGTVTFNDEPLWAAVPQGTLIVINEWQEAWYLIDTPPSYDPYNGGGLKREGGINGLGHQRGEEFNSTIHTLRDLSTDLSWNPAADDWSINVYAGERNPDSSFKYFTFTGTVTEPDGDDPDTDPDVFTMGVDDDAGLFAVNNDDWQITIRDDANNTIQGPIGEAVGSFGGINSEEILKIEDFPLGSNPIVASYLATDLSSYNDGASSTFGEANSWSSGSATEDLSPLRSWWDANLTQTGDLNGDGSVTTDDVAAFVLALTNRAMYDAQYQLPYLFVELVGDVNGDGNFDFGDIGPFGDLFSETSTSAGAAGVPEPTALALTILSLCGALLPARRNR